MNQRQAMRPTKTMAAMMASRSTCPEMKPAGRFLASMALMLSPTMMGTSVCLMSMKIRIKMPMR